MYVWAFSMIVKTDGSFPALAQSARVRGLVINPVMDQAQARAETANCLSSRTLYTVYFVHFFEVNNTLMMC